MTILLDFLKPETQNLIDLNTYIWSWKLKSNPASCNCLHCICSHQRWSLPIEFKLSMPSNCMDMANNSFLCLCTINLLSETIHEIIRKMYSVNPFIHQLMQSMCWLSLWILVVQISCNRYKLIFLFPFEERKLGTCQINHFE